MKKQIISLLLSAAIFTTSPLFAMDLPLGSMSGEEADPFRAVFMSRQPQDIEITSRELKWMSRQPCDNVNVQMRTTLPLNVLAYRFFINEHPYELQIFARKYVYSLKDVEGLGQDDLDKITDFLRYPLLLDDNEAEKLAPLVDSHFVIYENNSPKKLLEAFIAKGETVKFSRESDPLEESWNSRCNLPVVFNSMQNTFYMVIRTKY